jgi:hypothetical protein
MDHPSNLQSAHTHIAEKGNAKKGISHAANGPQEQICG